MREAIDPATYTLPKGLDETLAQLWSEDHFSVDGSDLAMLNACINAARPEIIVELGTATGLSTAALAIMQAEAGIDGQVQSFDLREVLWFDENRPVGDMIARIAGLHEIRVTLNTRVTALAVADAVDKGEGGLAFIDASHQHPWPALDTLLVLPQLKVRAPIIHHDLQLFLSPTNQVGVGPKILYDQLPSSHRFVASDLGLGPAITRTPSRPVADNVFVIWRREGLGRQARALSQSLLLPWSLTEPLAPEDIEALRERLGAHYHPEVLRNFDIGLGRFEAARTRAVAQTNPQPRYKPLRFLRD